MALCVYFLFAQYLNLQFSLLLHFLYKTLAKDIVLRSLVEFFSKSLVLYYYNRERTREERISHCYIGCYEKLSEKSRKITFSKHGIILFYFRNSLPPWWFLFTQKFDILYGPWSSVRPFHTPNDQMVYGRLLSTTNKRMDESLNLRQEWLLK